MADMAHTLIHWRFHLNEWVTDYLDDKGILDDEEILQRSHWSQRRKERYANETLAMMIETGEIQKLWRDFHINLRAARQSMVSLLLYTQLPPIGELCPDLNSVESGMNVFTIFFFFLAELELFCGNWIQFH